MTQNDVSRWRRGDWKRLTAAKRRALLRFLEEGGEKGDPERDQFDSLLNSPAALYATLSDFGAPGENAEDKLALIELISLVAARMRREGRRIPVDHLTEAHGKVIRGEI